MFFYKYHIVIIAVLYMGGTVTGVGRMRGLFLLVFLLLFFSFFPSIFASLVVVGEEEGRRGGSCR